MACSKDMPLALLDPPCFKYVLSKTLGYGIIAGSTGVKLPQLYKIVRAGSVAGLSSTAILVEMTSLISSFSYYSALGYPFSTWGENFFLFFQQILITAYYFHCTRGLLSPQALSAAAVGVLFGTVLYRRLLPDLQLPGALCSALGLSTCTVTCEKLAGSMPVLLMMGARLPQIVQNLKQGHTGQLALITYLLNTLGSGARIFTSMQELNDKLVLFSAASSCIQNGIITLQILALGGSSGGATKTKAASKKRD